jgi:ArsR family transcriptional regulator
VIQSVEVGMGGFAEAMLERVRGARDGLEVAHLAQDAFAVAVPSDELDDVLRLAREHGIEPGAGAGRERCGVIGVNVPLYQTKVEFFQMLGHPVRIQVLELLQGGPKPVRDLRAAVEIDSSGLSQQLAVLRRSGIATATRDGSSVVYALAAGDVTELMGAPRRILSDLLSSRRELLEELREGEASP